jgi:hypothetical protein
MSKTKLVSTTLALVAAIGAGVLIGHRQMTPPSGGQSTRDELMMISNLRTENTRLKGELDLYHARGAASNQLTPPVSPRGNVSMASPVEVLRRLSEMQSHKMISAKINRFLDPSGKLTEGFVAMLELTPTEQANLQRVIEKARERLAQYERANSTMKRGENGAATIAIKPFPELGGAVFDELMNSIAQTLGPERNAVFRDFGQEQVETEFSRFGAVQRKITFSASSPDPRRPFSFREELTTGPEWTSNRAFDFPTLAELKSHVGTVAGLLPDDFGKKK